MGSGGFMENKRLIRSRNSLMRSPPSRRALLGGMVVGSVSLLTACSSMHGRPANTTGISKTGPSSSLGSGMSASLAVPRAAVGAGATPRATTGVTSPAASPTSIVAPTSTDVPPTPAPSATAEPVLASTGATIPYDATRLTDLLGQSITSYAGSIAARVHNVRLATQLVDGATVAPGEVFSFDKTVGAQSVAHGFDIAWGIINHNGVPETVPAIAGGICQVATTLFQSVYWAGLPIARRYHHLYWIAHYGQPPYGQVGLDATVDFLPVDFQFKNTTSNWIRIEGTYDSTHVRFRLMGVDPGWKVTSTPTKITNVIKTDRATVRREDPTKPVGYELWVESAEDGFDATIERLVTKNGELVDRYLFTNHYEPAHNVLIVGTKGAKPTPTVSPTTVPPTVTPTVAPPTATPMPSIASYQMADGRIRVPSLIGMPESGAQSLINGIGLRNTYVNYQGKGDVSAAALARVGVGSVLSQNPAPGAIVERGTIIYLAVRKS